MTEKIHLNPGEKIEKITVPDDDAANWVHTLTEAGFSNLEIDAIMSHLNETYKNQLQQAEIDKEFRKIKEQLKEKKGYELSEEEAGKIKQGIASRFK